jgi:hypothetical protein
MISCMKREVLFKTSEGREISIQTLQGAMSEQHGFVAVGASMRRRDCRF